MEKGVVFFPDPILIGTPADFGFTNYEDVWFNATDGVRLHGWYVPGPDPRAVLLWFHGNAGNISYRLDNLKRLHDVLQIPIFIFDYREYGRSEGKISKTGTLADAEGAYRFLTEEKCGAESRIVLFGRSLGTALAVHVASRNRPLGLILEAAFTSTDDMMRLYFSMGMLPGMSGTKYDSLNLIDKVTCPTLFLHGEYDSTIPESMARTLHERARDPKFFHLIPGADHNDTYLTGGAAYYRQWSTFLELCLERPEQGTDSSQGLS